MLNYEYTPENVIIRDKNDLKSKLQQGLDDIKSNKTLSKITNLKGKEINLNRFAYILETIYDIFNEFGININEIIIPTMNVDRRLADGSRHREEVVNKS